MHHLQNVGHSIGCVLFNSDACQLILRDLSFLVTLLDLFMRDEVLSHNSADLFEVF